LWDSFTNDNYGLVFKFTDEFEALTTTAKQIAKFYTEKTHTNYLPYIEFEWDNQVKDERSEIVPGTTKRLYFYAKKDGVLTNVNAITDVTIRFTEVGAADIVITTINNTAPGIYYVDFTCPSVEGSFYDVWEVQYESGMTFSTIEQEGVIFGAEDSWTNDTTNTIDPESYNIMMPNFKSTYKTDESIYLDVNAVILYTSSIVILKNLEYSISLIDGSNRETFVDWTGVSYSNNDNFIQFDTSWLLVDNLYELSFRHQTDSSTYVNVQDRQFRIEA